MTVVPAARLRRHAVAMLAAALVTTALTACGVAAQQAAAPEVQTPAALLERADQQYAGARVIDDETTKSLVIVPKRSNGALVLFVHGFGQTHWSLLAGRKEATVSHTLSGAGFTVLSADGTGKAWGNPASVADYRGLIEATQERYGLRDVFLMGESMGGLATMQLARTLPDVRAVVAWYPVCDLRTMRQQHFQPTIRAAWKGLDRAAVSPVRVGATPLRVWASNADTVVRAQTNAAVCVAQAEAAGADVTYVHTSGNHGDPSNYQPGAVLSFFERYRSPGA